MSRKTIFRIVDLTLGEPPYKCERHAVTRVYDGVQRDYPNGNPVGSDYSDLRLCRDECAKLEASFMATYEMPEWRKKTVEKYTNMQGGKGKVI